MFSIRYSTRLVVLMFGIVIKIPLSRRGYLQCKNEIRMWERYKHLNILGIIQPHMVREYIETKLINS
jgi:hypothetical protein